MHFTPQILLPKIPVLYRTLFPRRGLFQLPPLPNTSEPKRLRRGALRILTGGTDFDTSPVSVYTSVQLLI